MTMKELSKCSAEYLDQVACRMVASGNYGAAAMIDDVKRYYHKTVRVVKGRKVPRGTVGECFWMGSRNYSRYGDPWGIYTVVRIGIKDAAGNVYWTSLDNVEVVTN